MPSSRLFDFDPIMRRQVLFHSSDDGNSFTLENQQDVTELLENNKLNRLDAQEDWKGDMHRVASIPLVLWMQLRREGVTSDPKAFRRWLNDPDNAAFRTKEGKV